MSPTSPSVPAPVSVPNGVKPHAHGSPAPAQPSSLLGALDTFARRHIGPDEHEQVEMLKTLGYSSLAELADQTVPSAIRLRRPLKLEGLPSGVPGDTLGEQELLERFRAIALQNKVYRSFIGMGYSDTITPPVILRNIMENPGWYTQYTPYQAEIAQGRLEALLNFQTMVTDLTGLPLAGASLLDEGTAAAEAMAMCHSVAGESKKRFLVAAKDVHPQTLAVVRTRGDSLGIDVVAVDDPRAIDWAKEGPMACGVLVQYPTTDGHVVSYDAMVEGAHAHNVLVVAAADLLALTLLKPPGEWAGGGADICVGSAQRFGVPMGAGGPHAAFLATKNEYARKMPGRLIGVSKDAQGNIAFRMAIQTREQHIKRDRATSNICTAQALLAIMAGMYAVYHGPEGLKKVAQRVRWATITLTTALKEMGYGRSERYADSTYFDTIRVRAARGDIAKIIQAAHARQINLRDYGDDTVGISFDETVTRDDIENVLQAFNVSGGKTPSLAEHSERTTKADREYSSAYARTSPFLTHPIFNSYHSEHEMLRYMFKLQGRDLSLAHSMIPLGSCTMKLNATSEMIPVTWPEFGRIHPFAPADQTRGYQKLYSDLEKWLSEITGFAAVSLQPNAGSQGEYAGLLTIRAYHRSQGQGHRDVCLIPDSAHGTNPASAVIAGLRVVAVKNDPAGNIDLEDLKAKAAQHKDKLACLMVTYPSTYGVFEEHIKEICEVVHTNGGQVYMDGANMNAQVGLTSPGFIGADVCHLNLHKTFCIPHGGGGPGMGPIGVAKHLAPFLPGHPVASPWKSRTPGQPAGEHETGPVSAAPFGSPSILTISWVYIALMGAEGLTKATETAILNANYMAKRLEKHYDVLFRGKKASGTGNVAHEFILDVRPFEHSAGIKPDDIAKRLMDYGFHAPTMSWPVPGTLMIEPTESESKAELDRFCEAMIAIRNEIADIESGKADKLNNVLKNAPHTAHVVTATEWKHPYTREQAAWPLPWLRQHKFWPAVGRIDNAYGDRNLVCACPPMSDYGS